MSDVALGTTEALSNDTPVIIHSAVDNSTSENGTQVLAIDAVDALGELDSVFESTDGLLLTLLSATVDTNPTSLEHNPKQLC